MSANIKIHYSAVTELVELMSIAGWIAVITDLVWVVRDYIVSDYPITLIPIFLGLSIGCFLLSYAIMKYHNKQFKEISRKLLAEKLTILKYKSKHLK